MTIAEIDSAHELLGRFDAQVRRNIAAEPGMRVERTGRIVRITGFGNCILYSELDTATADAAIVAQIEYFKALGRKFEWKLYGHDGPRDLGKRLARAGFQLEDEETFVVLKLHQDLPDTAPPAGIEIRRVTDARGLDDLNTVTEQAFGVDYSAMNEQFLERLALGTVSIYVAYLDTKPVCAGRLELPPYTEFAGLYGGGTAPAHRRKGIYRSLVAARARDALERGYRFLNVDAAEASLPILSRLGFVPLTSVQAWTWEPEDAKRDE
jgi:GNAT superfamily N-acetyltransferase